MKKIFNFGLALAVVAAMALVGCSNGGNSFDMGLGGDDSIANFAKGSTGVPSGAISADASLDTDGEAKIVELKDKDSFKLFKGSVYSKDSWEYNMDEPRSISISKNDWYTVNYNYYDITLGGASTMYYGEGRSYKDYPALADLEWTEYKYYDGKNGKAITKDNLQYWDKDSKYAEYVIAIDGKYYQVSSNGYDLGKDEVAFPGAKSVKFGTDAITVEFEYKDDNETYSVVYEFKDGGVATYKASDKYVAKNSKGVTQTYVDYVIGDEDGNPAEGTWTNNNGLIMVTIDGIVRTDKVSYTDANGNIYTKGTSALNPIVSFYYYNGIRFSTARYIGAYVEEIPEDVKPGYTNDTWDWSL